MASLNRRFGFAAVLLPLLFLAMSGLARANVIIVDTTNGENTDPTLCSLPDAINAINLQASVNGCAAGSFNDDVIIIAVTGQTNIDETQEIKGPELVTIEGPGFGCSGPGPCGITIDGEDSVQIFKLDPNTNVSLFNLTLADGHATTASPGTAFGTGTGGAIFANGTELSIDDCLLRNNSAQGPNSFVGGAGGAIFGLTGDITIVNSTIANNTAVSGAPTGSAGGGIFFGNPATQITNVTFLGNMADSGGGYDTLNSGTIPHVKGTLFASNPGGNCHGNPIDLNYNISDDASCAFSMPKSLNHTNPLLLPLANNGGPTDTSALEVFPLTSPAIGRIPVANCTDQNGSPLLTDQRLFPRPDAGDPNTCDSGAYEAGAVAPIVIVPNSEKLAVARSTTPNKDMVNTAFTFIYNGDPSCELGTGGDEDALNSGFSLSIFEGTCASLPANGLQLSLSPFVVHTVNHEQYGTLFQTSSTAELQQSSETVSARLITLPTPAGACSAFGLNLEVAGLDTATLGLSGGNPFAIVLTDSPDGVFGADASVCFDVNNAIVGNQTPPPPHKVRRRVRRR
jgi:hypothetical protein